MTNSTTLKTQDAKSIKRACRRDRAFQNKIARVHYCAKVIIHHYYAGLFTLEEAVSLLNMYCRRNREAALMNIKNSSYAQYSTEKLQCIL